MQKDSQELKALSRVAYRLDFNQRKLLLKSFMPQFSYTSVVWMFHGRKQNLPFNRKHKGALRVVYKGHSSSFDEPPEKENSCKIYDRNLSKHTINFAEMN